MKIYYEVPLQEMVTSYFEYFKKQMIVFDSKFQAIVYSYTKRTSTFVGMINKKSRNTCTNYAFAQKYVTPLGSAVVF